MSFRALRVGREVRVHLRHWTIQQVTEDPLADRRRHHVSVFVWMDCGVEVNGGNLYVGLLMIKNAMQVKSSYIVCLSVGEVCEV